MTSSTLEAVNVSNDNAKAADTDPHGAVTLISSDNQVFKVAPDVAFLCAVIKASVEDAGNADDPVPLPNVSGQTLDKVIEYCRYHVEANKQDSSGRPAKDQAEVDEWDAMFIDRDDQAMMFDIMLAANYLNLKSLLDLTARTVASMIKDMSSEGIRKLFNLENDFLPEEQEEISKWDFHFIE